MVRKRDVLQRRAGFSNPQNPLRRSAVLANLLDSERWRWLLSARCRYRTDRGWVEPLGDELRDSRSHPGELCRLGTALSASITASATQHHPTTSLVGISWHCNEL